MKTFKEFIQEDLSKEFNDFDQPPNSPWRKEAHAGNYAKAAQMIEGWLKDNSNSLDRYQLSVLIWHAGQMWAFANDYKRAKAAMVKSHTGEKDWDSYVDGTIAFMENDKDRLAKIIDSNVVDEPNQGILRGLLEKIGQSYSKAY